MSRIIGIDLGTTNSLVAVVDAGIPYVLADSQGRRITPSVVRFPRGQPPVVGEQARRGRVMYPGETVYSIKRFMGRRAQDVEEAESKPGYPLKGTGLEPIEVEIHGEAYRPEQISAEILRHLKREAETTLEETVTRAVITVPAYFNDAQRNATKQAGEQAGLIVERIVNEPTAAALAYGLDKLTDKSKVAVYDLGGGTFDLSVLELNNGVFQVLATNGNTRLGGDDIDLRIVDHLTQTIRERGGPDPTHDQQALARLREAAVDAKIRLSDAETAAINLPFLVGQYSFEYDLSRGELESISREVIMRTREHCMRSLADANLEAKDLDQVILVGGQTRMPLVRKMVAEFFQCAEFEEERGSLRVGKDYHRASGPRLNTGQDPDEAVALGAAIQGEILSGGLRNILLLDVTPLSLGIETFGGLMNVIIPRNSTIPVKAGEMFTTAVDYQKSMLIHVLQGERERAKDNWSLGKFEVEFERAPKGAARVGVQFEIDANGILHVLARDTKTGQQKVVDFHSAVDVEDSAVQQMVEESVEHAFEDLRARQWIEAKMRAEETLSAARQGLEAYAEELDEDYRGEVEKAINTLTTLLARQEGRESPGDPAALKEALSALDTATQPLAERMMDQAMEEILRRRGLLA